MIEMKECVLSRSRDSIGTLSNSHKDSKTFAPQKSSQPQPTSEKNTALQNYEKHRKDV